VLLLLSLLGATYLCCSLDVLSDDPIPKSAGRIKEGASAYHTGVTFDKQSNKWQARISIEGKIKALVITIRRMPLLLTTHVYWSSTKAKGH
jgi:hypothetical protein